MSDNGKKSQFIEYTKCPKCGTLFDVSDIDFSDSQGWVQCGDCTEQFDAAKHSVNYSALLEQSILSNADGEGGFTVGGLAIETTYGGDTISKSESIDILGDSDILDIKSKHSAATSSHEEDFVVTKKDFDYISKSQSKVDRGIDVVAEEKGIDDQYTLTKSRFKTKKKKSDSISMEHTIDLSEPHTVGNYDIDIEPDLYRELNRGSKSIWSSLLLYMLAIPVLLALGFVLLMQLQNRGLINWVPENVVAQVEQKAPFLVNTGSQSRSTDLSKIILTASSMKRHPTKKDYVNVYLQLTNKSKREQIHPALEVSFTDNVGKTIARRVFQREDFLSADSSDKLQSLESKAITLTFNELPPGSVGYEIRVIAPK